MMFCNVFSLHCINLSLFSTFVQYSSLQFRCDTSVKKKVTLCLPHKSSRLFISILLWLRAVHWSKAFFLLREGIWGNHLISLNSLSLSAFVDRSVTLNCVSGTVQFGRRTKLLRSSFQTFCSHQWWSFSYNKRKKLYLFMTVSKTM